MSIKQEHTNCKQKAQKHQHKQEVLVLHYFFFALKHQRAPRQMKEPEGTWNSRSELHRV